MKNRFSPKTFGHFETFLSRKPYGLSALDGEIFKIDDPFGLRRAIVPVFLSNPDGSFLGAGTAFHIDGSGTLLTADHVIDVVRDKYLHKLAPNALIPIDIRSSTHATVLLSNGVTFGTIRIPDECWLPINKINSFITEKEVDPIAVLRGNNQSYIVGPDLAAMKVNNQSERYLLNSIKVNLNAIPKIGDLVLAVGYPELNFTSLRENDLINYLNEGMFGVYGKVINTYKDGRSKSRPSPGFEVEAEWPPGMSGGPVFNQDGEVIGVVSSSVQGGKNEAGVGYAASLGMTQNIEDLLPHLDKDNPGYRYCLGIHKINQGELEYVFPIEENLKHAEIPCIEGCQLSLISHEMGTDNYMSKKLYRTF